MDIRIDRTAVAALTAVGTQQMMADNATSGVERYNVVWDSPSIDSLDSMPLSGRFGAGANVWVQDGSIWLYLAHNGAYDEQGRLLKLGCVRITPVDTQLGASPDFRQTLDLASGAITIKQGSFNASLWFAGETLIIEAESAKAQSFDVAFGSWRDQNRNGIRCDMMGGKGDFKADCMQADAEGITWFHRNSDYATSVIEKSANQGIEVEAVCDATTKRIFGGVLLVDGGISVPVESIIQRQFWEGKAWTSRTTARSNHVIAIRLGAKLDADPGQWRKDARSALSPTVRKAAKADELKRWSEFWSRSHIAINQSAKPDDAGWLIGCNYQRFRYMLACNRDGELPLLFNGGIFTTDNKPGRITGNNNEELPIAEGSPITPDFRRWMGCSFMSQNQRWLGWPSLANGDEDMLWPSLRFYRDRSAVAASRAKKNGAEGVVYPEPLDVWGLCCVGPRSNGLCGLDHLLQHFSMMLEHAWMALQARDVLGINLQKDMAWIEGTVLFYDSYYRAQCKKSTGKELGDDGKLLIYPGCALEYGGGATDPLDAVCGLTRVTAGLLALPDLPTATRSRLEQIQARLPGLPTGMRERRLSLLPARSVEREYNKWEPVEMYACWPYRLAGVTKPETLQLARDTWDTVPADRARLCKQDYSWMANVANMAALALPEEAKQRAIYKLANNTAPQARFSAFFGPGHDWLPDHNWGGAGCTGLQEMILAPEPGPHGKLYLFPAWPVEWDVDFTLHAPGQTVIEGILRGGKLISLNVTPKSRAKDVVNMLVNPPGAAPAPSK